MGKFGKRATRRGVPLTAEQVARNLRHAIHRHAADLNRRINHNASGLSAPAILAAFGAEAATLGTYLATAGQLTAAAVGTSGQ